jgi:hypothetical protein
VTSIRSGRGLGDAIYLQSIVRYLVGCGERLEVVTDWPDLFRPFGDAIGISPFRRECVNAVAHYTGRKRIHGTDQFKDCCLSVGISDEIEFRLEWKPSPVDLPKGRPVILLEVMREPFARRDGFGLDLLPSGARMQEAVDALRGRAFIVQVGKGKALHVLRGIGRDLVGRTTIPALLDLACAAGGFLAYCSFVAPLAEALNKPALFLWSRRGLNSANEYIRTIKPEKILRLPSSRWLVDDCASADIVEAVDALLVAAGSR